MTLYNDFKSTGKVKLKETLGKNNIHQTPVIDKVIVSMGIGSLVTRKGVKDFSDLEDNLKDITGQKAQLIKSKKSISNFKLREEMPVMLKVTLRKKKAFDFLERLNTMVLPRVRDYDGLKVKKFDGKGNYNMGFNNQVVFPEIDPEAIKTPMGIQVTICTTADDNSDAKELLKSLGFIFNEKK
ncbi:MAG: 50S ribosomal protein L5 [Candidatus Absconditabacteria bacterium]